MPTVILWAIIWCGALAVVFIPFKCLLPIGALIWLSAFVLASGKIYGYRLMKTALIFVAVWSLIILAAHLIRPGGSLITILNLWVWLGLGLNLILAKTPLELALPVGRIMAPVIGHLRAQKLALALALTARLIPRLLDSAIKIKTSLNLRAGNLPLTSRLILWGRAIIRDAFSESEELARALVKRWPW